MSKKKNDKNKKVKLGKDEVKQGITTDDENEDDT